MPRHLKAWPVTEGVVLGSDHVTVFVNTLTKVCKKVHVPISFSPVFISVNIKNVILGHTVVLQDLFLSQIIVGFSMLSQVWARISLADGLTRWSPFLSSPLQVEASL